jgi:hypothetical protein
MGNLGPVYLAWSNVRHKRVALFGPLLVLLVCHLLLFTQVGMLFMAPHQLPVAPPPTGQAADDSSSVEGEKERGKPRNLVAQGGTVAVFLVVLLLFRHIAATEMAGHAREFAMLHTLGYPRSYVYFVVHAEMLLLVLLAFVPAMFLLPGVDAFVRAWTGWPLALSWRRVGWVLLAALVLGAVASSWVTRQLRPPVEPKSLLR